MLLEIRFVLYNRKIISIELHIKFLKTVQGDLRKLTWFRLASRFLCIHDCFFFQLIFIILRTKTICQVFCKLVEFLIFQFLILLF